MTKIAVLGANGQVGAELCLILRNHPEVELIPICRNPGGSAFLRYHGLPCRHGLPADPAQAPALFGDCDVIVNSALGQGTPKKIREVEQALIANSLAYSPPHARIIYFSTQMVHGDPNPGVWVRWRGSYGRAKLRSESLVRAHGRRTGKEVYILRLGHVCGELQNITFNIRERIRTAKVVLPAAEGASNTVYTCTLADAILKIAQGLEQPGTYDLMSFPEWSWRQVYAYEAEQLHLPLQAKTLAAPPRKRLSGLLGVSALRSWLRALMTRPLVKEIALRLMAYAPRGWNERSQAVWYQSRARAEIQALKHASDPPEGLFWVAMASKLLATLTPTRQLLDQPAYHIGERNSDLAWSADLPLHVPTPEAAASSPLATPASGS